VGLKVFSPGFGFGEKRFTFLIFISTLLYNVTTHLRKHMDELTLEILLARIEKLSAALAIAELPSDSNPELDKARACFESFLAHPGKIAMIKVFRALHPAGDVPGLRDSKIAIEQSPAYRAIDGGYTVPTVNVEWQPGMPTETDNPEDDILHLWTPPGI